MRAWLPLLALALAALLPGAARAADSPPRYFAQWAIPDSVFQNDWWLCAMPPQPLHEVPAFMVTDAVGRVWVTTNYPTCEPDAPFWSGFFRQYDARGVMLQEWRSSLTVSGQYSLVGTFAAGPTGDLFALEWGRYVDRLSPTGQVLGRWMLPVGFGGFSLACDPGGNVFVLSRTYDPDQPWKNLWEVLVFDASGNSLGTLASAATGPGHLDGPGPMATDGNGHLFIADNTDGRIHVVDYDLGVYMAPGVVDMTWDMATFGSKGSAGCQFGYITSLAWDPAGGLYVCDVGNGRIEKFRGTGLHASDVLLEWSPVLNGYGKAVPLTAAAVDPRGFVYVVGYYAGQYSVQRYGPASASVGVDPPGAPGVQPRISAVAPQPARGRVSISFQPPRAGAVSLAIYDLAGRLVRTLPAGAAGDGTGTVSWDGRDEAGLRAPSGAYVVRLAWSGGSDRKKIVVLR